MFVVHFLLKRTYLDYFWKIISLFLYLYYHNWMLDEYYIAFVKVI